MDIKYDAYGRLWKQTMPYDVGKWGGNGTPFAAQTFPSDKTVVTTYDYQGRLYRTARPTTGDYTTTTYPDDLSVRTNAPGNLNTVTKYDVWGRVTEVHPPADPWLRFTYDAADRLVKAEKMTGGSGTVFSVTTMAYDPGGRKTSMSDPDLGAWSYTYDAQSNLKTQTDARGCTTTLGYDALSRLTQKSYGGTCGATTTAVTYGYDAYTAGVNLGRGKRTSMTDASGSTTWTYGDVRGRLTKESRSVSGSGGGTFTTEYTYDAADLLRTVKYPDPGSETVTTGYLPQMLVDSVVGSATYVQQTQYNASGRVELRKLGADQVRTDYVYNPWTTQEGRLQVIKSGPPSNPTALQNLTYANSSDHRGNVTGITDALAGPQTQTFTYDALDRLKTATASGGSGGTYAKVTYTYDVNGRLLNGPLGNGYVYHATKKHAVTAAGGSSYTYDANGNMTGRTVGGQSFTLVYDAENRLVQVSGAVAASFVYDGDGNRVKGTVGGVTTVYLGGFYEKSGSAVKKTYQAGGQTVALRDDANISDSTPSTLHWLLTDHLGGTSVTATGTVATGELRYHPFGKTRYTSGTTPTSRRYTGQREEGRWGSTSMARAGMTRRWAASSSRIPSCPSRGMRQIGIGSRMCGTIRSSTRTRRGTTL